MYDHKKLFEILPNLFLADWDAVLIFLNGPFPASFCLSYKQLTVNKCSKKVADDWIRTRFSGIGRDRSANCATTTASAVPILSKLLFKLT